MRLPDLSKYKRIAIVGRPKVGKTTLGLELSRKLGLKLVGTDDYIGASSFDDMPHLINKSLEDERTFILEGVQAARCLKYGLRVDVVLYLDSKDVPLEARHKGLASMVEGSMAGIKHVRVER